MKQTDKVKESPVPFQFCWGTFCRQVLQEQDSEDRSLINVLPGLNVVVAKNAAVEAAEKLQPKQTLVVPIGPLYAFAVFSLLSKEYANAEFDLEVRFAFVGLDQSVKVKLKFNASDITQLVVKLPMVQIVANPSQAEQSMLQKVSFHWKGYEVGHINLPCSIRIS